MHKSLLQPHSLLRSHQNILACTSLLSTSAKINGITFLPGSQPVPYQGCRFSENQTEYLSRQGTMDQEVVATLQLSRFALGKWTPESSAIDIKQVNISVKGRDILKDGHICLRTGGHFA